MIALLVSTALWGLYVNGVEQKKLPDMPLEDCQFWKNHIQTDSFVTRSNRVVAYCLPAWGYLEEGRKEL